MWLIISSVVLIRTKVHVNGTDQPNKVSRILTLSFMKTSII